MSYTFIKNIIIIIFFIVVLGSYDTLVTRCELATSNKIRIHPCEKQGLIGIDPCERTLGPFGIRT